MHTQYIMLTEKKMRQRLVRKLSNMFFICSERFFCWRSETDKNKYAPYCTISVSEKTCNAVSVLFTIICVFPGFVACNTA